MIEGAMSRNGVSLSHEKLRRERPPKGRSLTAVPEVATAKSLLQVLVGQLGDVVETCGDVLLLHELAHLVVEPAGESLGRRRSMRDAGGEGCTLELSHEALRDGVEDAGRHVRT